MKVSRRSRFSSCSWEILLLLMNSSLSFFGEDFLSLVPLCGYLILPSPSLNSVPTTVMDWLFFRGAFLGSLGGRSSGMRGMSLSRRMSF